ncbi:MAG: hypothetical protein JWM41_4578 [Gemmatimonadetes bacterium]|nr:hypothetical protein [Gemmatimonadota bacterium]
MHSRRMRAQGTEVEKPSQPMAVHPMSESLIRIQSSLRRASIAAILATALPLACVRAQCQTATSSVDATGSPARSDTGQIVRGAPRQTQTSNPAIVLFAEASAREVRFNSQPELRVRLCGGLDSIHVLERRNLPSPVVTNTTYRDVYVAVQIFGRLNADCIANTVLGGRRAAGRAADSSSRAATVGLDCASLEVRGTTPRPPSDSGRSPRR